ncbi:hypothetical protein LY76DRAFT_607144 [Colletotrichum caudatum]|nr:hypothetical protein LY76DRAFT_607144 [Colletotrichum caudatum]
MSSYGTPGDNPPAAPQPTNPGSMSATFAADQACKECPRRKAKCDRALPTCNLCVKYRRHCLYEKHARTPLTRKHLTEVEERLERAEALITHMRALMPAHARSASSLARLERPALIDSSFRPDPVPPEPGIVAHIEDENEGQLRPPHPTDDFEWDEQDTLTNYSASPQRKGIGIPRCLLWGSLTQASRALNSQTSSSFFVLEDGHITDAMVDAYFRSYHVSYPIIHEATFQAHRPSVWPYEGVEVSLPLNVDDKSLTAISKPYPPETQDITPYTAVRTQASFHIATTPIYTRVISKPLPTASEMLKLDQELLEPWRTGVPPYFSETATVPPKYALAHAVMNWRYRNLRVIMYRPFVIRRALQARDRRLDDSPDNVRAFEKCLADAKATITSISEFWERNEKNRLSAWYAYSPRCYQVIMDLCGRSLNDDAVAAARVPATHPQMQATAAPGHEPDAVPTGTPEPIDESPQTQINSVFSMMWPNVPPTEAADVVMGDDAWMEFLRSGTSGDGDGALNGTLLTTE